MVSNTALKFNGRLACFRCFDQDENEAIEARIICVKMLVEAGA